MKYLIATLLMYTPMAFADTIQAPTSLILKTIYKVARKSHVDAQSLIKIAFMESSFKVDARRLNPNKTVDYGMFQINSIHWTSTCKAYNIFTLQGNAECAAKLLTIAQHHSGTDAYWLGRYHSKTQSKKCSYSRKLASLEIEFIK